MMRMAMKHTVGLICLFVVYAPAKMCKAVEKEAFYSKVNSLLGRISPWDTLIVLGNFIAITGIEIVRY